MENETLLYNLIIWTILKESISNESLLKIEKCNSTVTVTQASPLVVFYTYLPSLPPRRSIHHSISVLKNFVVCRSIRSIIFFVNFDIIIFSAAYPPCACLSFFSFRSTLMIFAFNKSLNETLTI